jgi:hypothetical protein
MGDQAAEQMEELPFGGGGGQSNSNKRNSYHPGSSSSSSLNKRHSNIGMWGQKMFTNGHNFEQSTMSQGINDENKNHDVNQFLNDMHSEIKAMTNTLNNEVTTDANRKKNRISETPDRDLPKLAPISNGNFSKSHKMEEKSASSVINTHHATEITRGVTKNENEMQQAIKTKSTVQEYSAATYSEVQLVQNSCKISNQQEFKKQAELQVLEEREKRKQQQTLEINKTQQEMGNNVTIEETIFIRPNENIIEIEPDQVKYHTGETPHPNKFDPSKAYQQIKIIYLT